MAPPSHRCAVDCPACAIGIDRVETTNVKTYQRMRKLESLLQTVLDSTVFRGAFAAEIRAALTSPIPVGKSR
jgi:hypothetical protein